MYLLDEVGEEELVKSYTEVFLAITDKALDKRDAEILEMINVMIEARHGKKVEGDFMVGLKTGENNALVRLRERINDTK